MTEVIGIRFKSVGKVYYFSPEGAQFKLGGLAIVETARGIECGEVVMENQEVEDSKVITDRKSVV